METNPKTPLAFPMMITFASTLIGAAMGGAAAWKIQGDKLEERPVIEVARDYTDDELEKACQPFIQNATSGLEEAQMRVDNLSAQVLSKEQEIIDLEEALAQQSIKSEDDRARLDLARSELRKLKNSLTAAEEEKAQLVAELLATQEELQVQVAATERAVRSVQQKQWQAFQGDAQLEICDKGNRKKLEKCRTAVDASLANIRDQFAACVESGQAVPYVRKGKTADMPAEAQWLDENERLLNGWYVVLCDEALPESNKRLPVDADLTEADAMIDEVEEAVDEMAELDGDKTAPTEKPPGQADAPGQAQ